MEHTPGQVQTDEADKRQLELAREEGRLYQRALDYMVEEVADNGAKTEVGDYLVAIAQERAEGMYAFKGEDDLVWQAPGDENCHLEVSVSDLADKRFIPGLEIEATVIPKNGGERIGPFKVPFLWHPGLYHYGIDITVPGDGVYDIHVKIAPPTFMRHDDVNGKRYARTETVTFEDFKITTGQE